MKKTTENQTKNAPTPRYALRKGLGFWEVTFEGQRAYFKHEKGAAYVAYLLLNPPDQPVHGLALALKTQAICGRPDTATEITDPASGKPVLVTADAVIQERNLGLDDAEAARALQRKQLELEALVEDEDQIEPVKAEAQRELEAIYQFQEKNPWRTRRTAQRTADTVGRAVRRFYQRLTTAVDAAGNPDCVLRSFAAHLKRYLLVPSGRSLGRGGPRIPDGYGGCFTYRPPKGIVWSDKS